MELEEYSKEALQEELERRDKKVSAHLVKDFIKKSNVKQWQIAEFIGISEYTFCKKLRKDIKEEDFLKIQNAVEEIKKER